MNQLDQHQKIVQSIRNKYNLIVPIVLTICSLAFLIYLNSTMPERRLKVQLKRVKTLSQLEKILHKSSVKLNDDSMAEIYFNCALLAFVDKEYIEACKLLQKVVDSQAHIVFRSSALYEMANSYYLAGDINSFSKCLNKLINSPDTPQDIKDKALLTQQQFGSK